MQTFTRRTLRWLFGAARSLWLVAGLAILFFFAMELTFWGISILGLIGQESTQREMESRPDTQLAYRRELARALQLKWHPETCWTFDPVEGEHINVDADGRRRTWADPMVSSGQEPPVEIWCFGGSTLWGFGSRDEHTIPSEVAKHLTAKLRAPVQVVNFAVPGYVFAQESALLHQKLRKTNPPQVVIFFDGYNDLISAFVHQQPGVPLWDYHYREGTLTKVWHATGSYRHGRALLHQFLPHFVGKAGPSAGEIETLAEAAVDDYLQRVRYVNTVNQGLGMKSLFFWQPTLFDKKSRTAEENRFFATLGTIQIGKDSFYTTNDTLETYFAAAKRVLAQRLEGSDLPVIDLGSVVASEDEELFFDGCHFVESANTPIAKVIASKVEYLLPINIRKAAPIPSATP